jgi:hypothetical protein
MVRKCLFGLIFILVSIVSTAQSFTIQGRLQDVETKASVQGATISLTSASDSSVRFSMLSDSAGRFAFTRLSRDSFRLSVSSVTYNSFPRGIRIDSSDVTVNISLSRSSKQLEEVTIISAAPPATQKGDTVQFSASQFKVNPDASAEDLAKKIPGITVENGQVKANGENVQKVTIDGRELFGDDATAALRNLPAEVIDKIQVFDRLSDQAQLTGFDDGNTQRGINIVTKANMRNGQFGRVFAGYGTDERYSAGGNATFFKNNRRVSFVGNFNNVNQQNFSQQDLLGVTSSNNRGGGGGGNPGGNRGGGNTGGNRGGGGGNFGNAGNFLVGQQPGINRTNAFGVNYSDNWGKKLVVTGSYFFSDTKNNTEELVRTQYVSGSRSFSFDTTSAESNNTSHRVNMRFEYKIDSNNTLIITPNLSFQKNESDRRVSRSFLYNEGNKLDSSGTLNLTNSLRNANNLNNSILFRHSFAKRGRSISFNFRTSYNERVGETFVNTNQQSYFSSGLYDDSVSHRFTDQFNNGLQLSGNLNYTEPIGKESQLQFSYNPSVSKNTADQKAFARDSVGDDYSIFINNLSSEFKNKTTAQNGGISYRWGNRDRTISFGANYQQTRLESDQKLPRVLNVDKTFSNVLPNAQVRYKISPKSSLRFNYRANVNQPSVTQLQGVVDPNNAPNYSEGNPDLEQQYMHILSGQYTFTNTQKGLLMVGNLFYQNANNYITNAIFNIDSTIEINGVKIPSGSQLSRPVNLDGYASVRSFLTFAMPVKFIKSNLNFNGGYTFSKLPGFIDTINTTTRANTFTLGSVISSNISQYVDFTVSYSGNFNKVNSESVNSFTKDIETTKDQYYNHVASLQMNLLSKKGWFFQNDVSNLMTSGLSEGFNQNYLLWNMGVGKKFLPQNKGELKVSVFDLLKQNRSINRTITDIGNIEDTRNVVLQQYFMLTFTYNLKNFGTAAARQMNRERER